MSFANGHAAGVAYAQADVTRMPTVAYKESGRLVTVASARTEGKHEDGTNRIVKGTPRATALGAGEFVDGYFAQLAKQLDGQLSSVDWNKAKPALPGQAPRLPGSIYDDLEALAKHDFPSSTNLWNRHCNEYEPPAFLNPAFKSQISGLKAVTKALNALQDVRTPKDAKLDAARSLTESIVGRSIPDPATRERLARALAAKVPVGQPAPSMPKLEKAVQGRSR